MPLRPGSVVTLCPEIRLRAAAVVLASAGMCLAAVTVGLFGGRDTYQETTRTPICVGREVVVCGPPDGRAVLTIAQTSLQGAIRRLATTGIPWRQRYYLASGPRLFDLSADAGQLQVATEDIRHGALSQHDLAATLAMPRVCEAFLGAEAADEQLLAKQGRVLDWVTQALGRPETAPRAPTDVVAAFAALATCAPLRSTPP